MRRNKSRETQELRGFLPDQVTNTETEEGVRLTQRAALNRPVRGFLPKPQTFTDVHTSAPKTDQSTAAEEVWVLKIIASIAVVIAALFAAVILTLNYMWQTELVERGFAEIDPSTGEWEWVEYEDIELDAFPLQEETEE